MASGSRSPCGSCTGDVVFLPVIAPVPSLFDAAARACVICGMATLAVASDEAGAVLFRDCRPIGFGEVSDGAGGAGCSGAGGGLTLESDGVSVDGRSADFSIAGV